MAYRLAADGVLIVHLLFIAFVIFGGLAALKYAWLAFAHIPAAAWGAYTELMGRVCPLTTLEVKLRLAGGGTGYSESFIEHYLEPVIYPAGLTRGLQLALGTFVISVNVVVYGLFAYRRWRLR